MYKLCKKLAAREGFTLVELIVVIAILGILAGVAVPVYSGYIDKAGEAGDLQLLGAMNTAYAAACVEMGVDPTEVNATATLSGEPGSKLVTGVTPAVLNDAFFRYFAGNEGRTFKKYTSLGYDRPNGVFVDGAKEYTFTTANGTVTVTAAQLGAYMASTFATEMTVEELTGAVDTLAGRVINSGLFAGNKDTITNLNPDFVPYLESLGLDYSEMTAEQAARALVLYAAAGAKDIDKDTWYNAILTGSSSGISPTDISGTSAVFALMTAYANSDIAKENPLVSIETGTETISKKYNKTEADFYAELQWYYDEYGEENVTYSGTPGDGKSVIVSFIKSKTEQSVSDYYDTAVASMNTTEDVSNMFNAFYASEGFQTYLATQGKTDMDGFFSTMDIINANTGSVDLNQILSYGFSDDASGVNALINAILGNP